MPRERIQHGKQWVKYESADGMLGEFREFDPAHDDGHPRTIHHTDPSLDLTWNRGAGWVQLSIDVPREKWLETASELDANPTADGRDIYTDVLDRRTINHLIRTLRRARDAAYGVDE